MLKVPDHFYGEGAKPDSSQNAGICRNDVAAVEFVTSSSNMLKKKFLHKIHEDDDDPLAEWRMGVVKWARDRV